MQKRQIQPMKIMFRASRLYSPLLLVFALFLATAGECTVASHEPGNTLSEEDKSKLFHCLKEIPSGNGWLRELFFYNDGMACLNFAHTRTGPRSFYNLALLEQASGVPLDSRPESKIVAEDNYSIRGQLMINPELVRWLDANFTGLQEKSPLLYSLAKEAYESKKGVVRSFVFAYEYLVKYDNYQNQIYQYDEAAWGNRADMLDYLKRFSPAPEQGYDKTKDDYDDGGNTGYRDGINRFRFAVGFWLRRGIDSTADDFKNLLVKIMQEYDAEWFANHPI